MHVGIGKPDPHPVDSVNQSSHQDGVTALARLVVTVRRWHMLGSVPATGL